MFGMICYLKKEGISYTIFYGNNKEARNTVYLCFVKKKKNAVWVIAFCYPNSQCCLIDLQGFFVLDIDCLES